VTVVILVSASGIYRFLYTLYKKFVRAPCAGSDTRRQRNSPPNLDRTPLRSVRPKFYHNTNDSHKHWYINLSQVNGVKARDHFFLRSPSNPRSPVPNSVRAAGSGVVPPPPVGDAVPSLTNVYVRFIPVMKPG
jgi:hypothetical protein